MQNVRNDAQTPDLHIQVTELGFSKSNCGIVRLLHLVFHPHAHMDLSTRCLSFLYQVWEKISFLLCNG